jgi:hypothetical protein
MSDQVIPPIPEETLKVARDVLLRDLKMLGAEGALFARYDLLKAENPDLLGWIMDTARDFHQYSTEVRNVDTDDPPVEMIPVQWAQNQLIITALQVYHVIRARLEAEQLQDEMG